ncbi:hypothetical protein TRVA0_061S00166 [Trichomonascus vanleenenianus]|uniref:flavin-containing monooxygenase n=1 Tax=Trichomonascus vanleenenianus TaxID=2268995 RepID=UPI003ECA965A
MEDYDVIIIGSGISGINAAYRIQTQLPGCRYIILEARNSIGGTWSFFRYPGIRSDSDLFTFGFPWKPWKGKSPIARAELIMEYLHEAVSETGIDKHIRLQQKVTSAEWTDKSQSWAVSVNDANNEQKVLRAKHVIMGTGYYDYDQGLKVDIPGLTNFKGTIAHPQFWPEDLDYSGKNVVIIGSGATAITLLPNMAQKAAHVTMLQRSPTYILSIPNSKRESSLSQVLPQSWAFYLTRLFFLIYPVIMYGFCQVFPNAARNRLQDQAAEQLPGHIPVDPHFTPRYKPWDQRLCMSPDGDFFEAMREGRADVATGTIREIEGDTIILHGGQRLQADIIVTATGLKLKAFGGIKIVVNGSTVDVGSKYAWNNAMLQDVPNFVFIVGYINASWTLGADATSQMFCRLVKQMDREKYAVAVPRVQGALQSQPLLPLKSTYVAKGARDLPMAGDSGPWTPRTNYFFDLYKAKYGDIRTGMEFTN